MDFQLINKLFISAYSYGNFLHFLRLNKLPNIQPKIVYLYNVESIRGYRHKQSDIFVISLEGAERHGIKLAEAITVMDFQRVYLPETLYLEPLKEIHVADKKVYITLPNKQYLLNLERG